MTVQFRNKVDTRCYAAAEDAYTSEGGFLAQEDEGLEKDADREARRPSRDFRRMVGLYAAGMQVALTVFSGSFTGPATRSANLPAS